MKFSACLRRPRTDDPFSKDYDPLNSSSTFTALIEIEGMTAREAVNYLRQLPKFRDSLDVVLTPREGLE